MIDLDGRTMFVSSTADNGVVGSDTRLYFTQRGARVVARYSGGRIVRGCLAGRWIHDALHFRYAQNEGGDGIHGGQSTCRLEELPDGRVRLVEHFAWSTRQGAGVNVFEELPRTAR